MIVMGTNGNQTGRLIIESIIEQIGQGIKIQKTRALMILNICIAMHTTTNSTTVDKVRLRTAALQDST